MVDDDLYTVVWTPGFVEDVMLAVEYVDRVLKAPFAARNLLDGISAQLENVRAMPTSAVTRTGLHGERIYMVSYKEWSIYYTVEQRAIKAIGLKDRLQRRA